MTTNTAQMSRAELEAEIARLKEAAKAKPRSLTCKVSQKGAVSVYGMGRFPVTLYREQWERLGEFMPEVQSFIADHAESLATKG